MRPKTKNTIFHAQTTKNTKNKTTKKKKQTTTTQTLFIVVFLSHSRPLYSSHTTHHPTNNTQPHATHVKRPQPARYHFTRGDLLEQQPCCPRHPTACQKNKTNHQNQNTNTLILASLIPPHTKCVRDFVHLKNRCCPYSKTLHTQTATKNVPPPGT